MRRTLLVVGPLPPPVHGASRVTQAVVDGLHTARAASSTTVTSVSTAAAESLADRGVRYHGARVVAHARAARVLLSARSGGPVTLYIGGAGGGGLWYQMAIIALARVVGAVVVFHHHSYSYLTGPSFRSMRWISRLMGRDGLHVCLSEAMSELFRSSYAPVSPVVTATNAQFVPLSPRRSIAPDGLLRLIHISNLSREKGTVAVLEAFAALRSRGERVSLTLVGEAHQDDVRLLVEAACRDHPDAVRHHGPSSREEVFRALDAADLFVFPTSYRVEAQPLVVIEALARGVPVLASDRGAIPELLPREWLIDDLRPLEDQILALAGEDRAVLADHALRSFERSRSSGVDLVELLSAGNVDRTTRTRR